VTLGKNLPAGTRLRWCLERFRCEKISMAAFRALNVGFTALAPCPAAYRRTGRGKLHVLAQADKSERWRPRSDKGSAGKGSGGKQGVSPRGCSWWLGDRSDAPPPEAPLGWRFRRCRGGVANEFRACVSTAAPAGRANEERCDCGKRVCLPPRKSTRVT
jgi:hypothetical protein